MVVHIPLEDGILVLSRRLISSTGGQAPLAENPSPICIIFMYCKALNIKHGMLEVLKILTKD